MSVRRLLVTSALPYANGPIHLGHLVEYLQTDMWVRFQKLQGRRCIYLCADDTHGTAIMMRARQEGRSEEALIAEMQAAHLRDFTGFEVEFDHYGSTNSGSNRALCAEFWTAFRQADLIREEDVAQLYDPQAQTFLADRFVKGTCPHCQSPNQYGDNCESCGRTYSPAELINPVSTLSGATPELRTAKHLFVELEKLHGFLEDWTQVGDRLQPEIANYLKGHFLNAPLRNWDVSRPAPYFGFAIPDAPGHYWYVWFDAPIGYLASTFDWCQKSGENFEAWWKDPHVEIHHFIGKDITYFHTLFWPAMLHVAGYSLPRRIHIHGFLTVNGEKMAKRTGIAVQAATYLEHLDPAYLRYYYATKLSPRVDDLDLNLEDFVQRVNSDLVGKVVNLASRTAKFVQATGLSATYPDDGGLFARAAEDGGEIASAYEACDFGRATRAIMVLADRANHYVDQHQPWTLKKDPAKAETLQQVCTVSLNLFRQIVIYLAPVLPKLARQTGELLGQPLTDWNLAQTPLVGTPVQPFQHLMKRVETKQVEAILEATRAAYEATEETSPAPATSSANATSTALEQSGPSVPQMPADGPAALAQEPLVSEIVSIDDFTKLDLRVVRILAAEDVSGSKKLLRLTVTLGGKSTRTIFAGIKGVYDPSDLVGRLAVIIANLAPRKMPFGVSEGMVLAAGPGGQDIFLLSPDSGAVPGQRIH